MTVRSQIANRNGTQPDLCALKKQFMASCIIMASSCHHHVIIMFYTLTKSLK